MFNVFPHEQRGHVFITVLSSSNIKGVSNIHKGKII